MRRSNFCVRTGAKILLALMTKNVTVWASVKFPSEWWHQTKHKESQLAETKTIGFTVSFWYNHHVHFERKGQEKKLHNLLWNNSSRSYRTQHLALFLMVYCFSSSILLTGATNWIPCPICPFIRDFSRKPLIEIFQVRLLSNLKTDSAGFSEKNLLLEILGQNGQEWAQNEVLQVLRTDTQTFDF